MFFYCSVLFALFTIGVSAHSLEDEVLPHHTPELKQADDYVLCRSCGGDIASSSHITYIKSPAAVTAFNDTLFNLDKVLVQVLPNDIFLEFPVITSVQSTCLTVGEWEVEESWFPGYNWQICVCPQCGEYIGWAFERDESSNTPFKRFFGLLLPNLIGESCKYFQIILGGLGLITFIVCPAIVVLDFVMVLYISWCCSCSVVVTNMSKWFH